MFGSIGDFFGGIFSDIGDFFGGITGGVGDFFGGIFSDIGDFFSNIQDFIQGIFSALLQFLTVIIQLLLELVAILWNLLMDLLNLIIATLPPSPFAQAAEIIADDGALGIGSELLAFINWIVPLAMIQSVLYNYLLAIAVWYVARIILRWFKVAGS